MTNFTVSPVFPSDLPSISAIVIAAFYRNPRTISYHKFSEGSDVYEWCLRRTIHDYHTITENRYSKLVDNDSGSIVAFTIWQVPQTRGTDEQEEKRKEDRKRTEEQYKKDEVLPEGANKSFMDEFEADTNRMREKYVDSEVDYGR